MPREDLKHFHSEGVYAFQAMRLVSEGLDFPEVARVLQRVSTPADWTREMTAAGASWEARAEKALDEGRSSTARSAFHTATHFFLGAALWNTPDPWGTVPIYRRAVRSFQGFAELLGPDVRAVQIPLEGTTLPGYLFLPPAGAGNGKEVPGVVLMGGADATKEECYGFGVPELLERGIACLILDGPGQGEALREQRLFTRPDYEVVYRAAIDFLRTVARVDGDRLGIVGLSMGGYYVMRGALSSEVRAAVSWGALMAVDHLNLSILGPTVRFITGAQDDDEMQRIIADFTLDGVADRITCPVLLVHGGQDHLVPPAEVEQVRAALTKAAVEVQFYEDALHCCVDQYAIVKPRIYDWLLDKLTG